MGRTTTPAAKTTSVSLTQEMLEMVIRISQDRYGVRGMARSIEDWLADLLKQRDFLSRYAAITVEGSVVRKSIRLTGRAEDMIEDAIKRIRKVDPLSKDVQTRLLRAAFDLAIEQHAAAMAARPVAGTDLDDQAQMEIVVPLETARPRLARKPARKRA